MAQVITEPRLAIDELSSRGIMYAVLCVVILVQYAYVFTFNWVPELRLPLSSALAGIHVVAAGLTILLRPAAWNKLLLLSAVLLFGAMIPPHALGFGEVQGFDMVGALRKLVLPLMMIWVLAYPLAIPRRLITVVAVCATVAGCVIAITGDPVYVSGTPRLGSITGGPTQMHPSAKFLALQLVLLDLLWRGRMLSGRVAWPLIGLTFIVLDAYGGRNEMVFVLAYYAALAYFHWRHITIVRYAPPLLLILGILAAAIAFSVSTGVEAWGSGRIGVWTYRLQLIAERDIMPFLFGGGVGADVVWTPQWWFFEDGSTAHNDYLHIVMESGVVGLIALGALVLGLWLRLYEEGRAIIIAVLVNSMFANGFFQSPLLAMNMTLILAYSIVVSLSRTALTATRNHRMENAGASETAHR